MIDFGSRRLCKKEEYGGIMVRKKEGERKRGEMDGKPKEEWRERRREIKKGRKKGRS